jgi:signal-transduction protein with cAMP-binding, CBS, and nucleotidyltransferase domain
MKVRDLTWRPPVTIDCGAMISAAAVLLADEGVGALVVLDRDRPVGVVTDRDLVTRGIAKRVPFDARIDSLMSMGVVALDADEDAEELFAIFARHAVRRVPIVEDDRVVGMVTLDDALVSTVTELTDLVGVLSTQIAFPNANAEPATPSVVDAVRA